MRGPDSPKRQPPAQSCVERLRDAIQAIEAQAKENEQVVLEYSAAGERLKILSISPYGADMMTLAGHHADGTRFAVFAHLHTVQFIMTLEKTNGPVRRQTIVFTIESVANLLQGKESPSSSP